MPYIKGADRELFDEFLEDASTYFESPGDLNYCISKLCYEYLAPLSSARYVAYNEVIGVLESAKLEIYRRLVSVYEDQKKFENGDVYN